MISIVAILLCATADGAEPSVRAPAEETLAFDAGLPIADAGVELDAGLLTPDAGSEPAKPDAFARMKAETPEDPGEDGAELEAMHALEAASLDPQAQSGASLRETVSQLGVASLTRDRLDAALDSAAFSGEDLPLTLDPVTDVLAFDVSKVRDRYDIPVEMQPLVAQYVHFFQGAGRKWFRRWVSRSYRFIPLMQPILEAKGLPRDLVYLSMIESGFNTQAKSWARAVGPWQFIPGTAVMFNLHENFWIDERRDPIKSTYAAADFLGLLYEKLGDWYLAWAGYNTGGGRVRYVIEKAGGSRDFWELSEVKKGFAKETKHYVPKLIACALVAKHLDAFGFTPDEFDPEPAFDFDEVQLTDQVDLEVIAQASGSSLAAIEELNPELKRWCTPPASADAPYTLRIPKGTKPKFVEEFAKYSPQEKLNYKVHLVARGDTLSTIASKYHSVPEAIMHINGMASAKSLKLGTELVVPVPSEKALKAGRADVALQAQVAKARRAGVAAGRPEDQQPAGAVGSVKSTPRVGAQAKTSYVVSRGDSLWSIARKFDVHVSEIQEWNPSLAGPRGLKVGTALTMFGSAPAGSGDAKSASPGAAKGARHTVESGDNLSKIASKYHVSVDELREWNKLSDDTVKLGQKLLVGPP